MRNGFDFADIMDEVLTRALGETTTAEDVTAARRSIYMVLDEWHALQYNTWRVAVRDFGYTPGAAVIQLPTEVDDIMAATVVQDTGSDIETPLRRMTEAEYANLSNKDTPGKPSQYRLRRTEPPVMTLYPTGQVGRPGTVRITYIKRPEMFDRYDNNVDAPGRWLRPLIYGAAADLAAKNPERAGERLAILTEQYRAALVLALPNDRDRTDFRMRIG